MAVDETVNIIIAQDICFTFGWMGGCVCLRACFILKIGTHLLFLLVHK